MAQTKPLCLVLRDLGGLEEADEQGRLYKVVDESPREAHAKEELVRRHAIVRLKSRLATRGAGLLRRACAVVARPGAGSA